jgi:hypothetical protein
MEHELEEHIALVSPEIDRLLCDLECELLYGQKWVVRQSLVPVGPDRVGELLDRRREWIA